MHFRVGTEIYSAIRFLSFHSAILSVSSCLWLHGPRWQHHLYRHIYSPGRKKEKGKGQKCLLAECASINKKTTAFPRCLTRWLSLRSILPGDHQVKSIFMTVPGHYLSFHSPSPRAQWRLPEVEWHITVQKTGESSCILWSQILTWFAKCKTMPFCSLNVLALENSDFHKTHL